VVNAQTYHLPVAHQRTLDQIVSARDHYDWLLQCCPPVYQHALTMLRDGYTVQEIAEQLGLSERTIHRFMKRLREPDS
jgi:DNA-binding NarL/FixJ family response regulator